MKGFGSNPKVGAYRLLKEIRGKSLSQGHPRTIWGTPIWVRLSGSGSPSALIADIVVPYSPATSCSVRYLKHTSREHWQLFRPMYCNVITLGYVYMQKIVEPLGGSRWVFVYTIKPHGALGWDDTRRSWALVMGLQFYL